MTLHLTGLLSYQEMFEGLNVAIHQFAKRQMTWFRRMEKQGIDIHWLDGYSPFGRKGSTDHRMLFFALGESGGKGARGARPCASTL